MKCKKIAIIAINIQANGRGVHRFEIGFVKNLSTFELNDVYIDIYVRKGIKKLIKIKNPNINVIEIKYFKKYLLLNSILFFKLLKNKYELIHFLTDPTPIFNINTKCIVTIHELLETRKESFFKKKIVIHYFLSFLSEKMMLLKTSKIITNSKYVFNSITTKYPKLREKVKVITPGLEKGLFYKLANIKKDSFLIIISGDRDINIELLNILIKKGIKINCIGKIPKTIVPNDSIVEYLNIRDQQVRLLYNKALLYVHLSKSEGFGYPVIEALKCGTKVIAPNSTALSELLPSEYLYNNIQEFSNKLNCFINMKSAEYFKNIDTDKYSWQKTVNNYIQLYRELIIE